MQWMLLVLLYGVIKGVRDIIKKKTLETHDVIEVLFMYTLLGFLLLVYDTPNAIKMDMSYLGWIFVKSFVIFIAWICSYKAISKIPVSVFGVMDMARVLFATLFGVVILHESMTGHMVVGMLMVLAGLFLVNLTRGRGGEEKASTKYTVMLLVSCFLNAVSELFDKTLMSKNITSGQLQYWYMLFMVLLYLGYIIVTRMKIDWKRAVTNYWVWILSIIFIIGDRALFVANKSGESTIVAMTLIKQSSVLISVLGGRVVFKEKNITARLLCAALVCAGVVVAVM